MQPSPLAVILLGLWVAFCPSPLRAQEVGGSILLRGVISENVYAAGGTVDLLGTVEKDLVAAGGNLNIRQLIKGDVTLAGGFVNLNAKVGDDVRAVGGTVIVGAEVGGDVVVAGGTITLSPEARFAGRTWLSGGRVNVAGQIGRKLRVVAGTVRLGGQIDGDVELVGGDIEIASGARIKGNVTYTSPREATIAPGAQIMGKVTFTRSDLAGRIGRIGRILFGIIHVVFLLGLILAGIVLLRLFPNFAVAAARTIGSDPWKSLGLGFALLVVTPIAATLVMATIIGIPIGLTALAVYCVAVLMGYLTAAVFLGEVGRRLFRRTPEISRRWRVFSLIFALILLAVVSIPPILGGVVTFLAVTFGLGALACHTYRRYAGE